MAQILLVILLAYLVLRLWIRFRHLSGKTPPVSKNRGSRNPFGKTGPSTSGPIIDEMKACANCETYIPSGSALRHKGLYFCDQGCHEAYQKKHL